MFLVGGGLEYKVFKAYTKDNPIIAQLSSQIKGAQLGVTQGIAQDSYFHAEYDTWYGKGLKLKLEDPTGSDYSYKNLRTDTSYEPDIPIKAKSNRSIDEYVLISQGKDPEQASNTPKMQNEGIIEGTRRGSRIIAGENYTSEAVVSTKPNTVTETIGKNLYDIIKRSANSDISSTQRQSTIITDALKNTIQSYYDMTKISPLNAQGGQTIVNNFVGCMGAGNIPETNAQFNSGGLTAVNTETVLQKVYMDAYKAALL